MKNVNIRLSVWYPYTVSSTTGQQKMLTKGLFKGYRRLEAYYVVSILLVYYSYNFILIYIILLFSVMIKVLENTVLMRCTPLMKCFGKIRVNMLNYKNYSCQPLSQYFLVFKVYLLFWLNCTNIFSRILCI